MAAEPKVGGDVRAALWAAGLLIGAALLADSAAIGMVVTVLVFFLLVYAMTRVPLRHSMLTLFFFVLVLPNPAEGFPTYEWTPPFTMVGAILLNHLNTVDRSLSSLSFSGIDLLIGTLFLIALYRRQTGSKIDLIGRAPTPKPLIRAGLLALGTVAFVWLSGLVRGGEFGMSLWQVNCVLFVPLVFFLFQMSLRGPKDHWILAKVILVAAVYRAILAVYVINNIQGPLDPQTGSTTLAFATSHQDSVLFADAFVLVLALNVERVGRWAKWLALGVLPILAAGIFANHRRLAWVHVGLVFLTVYLVSREGPIKRKIRRTLMALSPVVALYLLIGWNQASPIFKPVKMVRSIVDAQSDASSYWRELENFNVIMTFRENPLFGTGYGHGYHELIPMPAVDYSLERYIPHNTLLGQWCYAGLIGFAGLSMLWTLGVYYAMRVYYWSNDAAQRAAALVSFGTVLVYMMQSWGDIGLGTWNGAFTMGAALSVAGKLATSNGQWGTAKPKKPPPTQAAPAQAANVAGAEQRPQGAG